MDQKQWECSVLFKKLLFPSDRACYFLSSFWNEVVLTKAYLCKALRKENVTVFELTNMK